MTTDVDRGPFIARAKEIAGTIRDCLSAGSYFVAVSHHDADGISSASIIGSALAREKTRFTVRIVEELREDVLDGISRLHPDVIVFSDIGSGYMDLIKTRDMAKTIIILDHHPPNTDPPESILQLNPHDYKIDGARLISAAGVCYLVAREISEHYKDLSSLAIVGALGDMQDKNEKRALIGMNEILVEDGIASGTVRVDQDLVLYGRETRPIHRALAYTTTPYLPNLSGREDNCLTLLSNSGIPVKDGDRFRTVADLSQDEKKKILDAIIGYLVSIDFQTSVVKDLIGTVYTLTNEPPGSPTRDAREYSAMLNACGRTENPSIGISVGLGDRKTALQEAIEVVASYRKILASYMEWLTNTPDAIQKFKTIWVIRGENQIQDTMTGAFSSIISSAGNLSQDSAIIVLTKSKEGGIKLSARAPPKLLKAGVNLGAALSAVSKKYSGFGGGHNVAAGAHIRVEDPVEFLQDLDEAIQAQMDTRDSGQNSA
ncbi:MAG: DHH family phosphoesterase [Candidatus Bathyarchaeia archaeon]|jgi:RecJ-like exonuclease